MFTVTERAAHALYQFLQSEGKEDHALRVVAQEGGCSCCGPTYGLFLEKEMAPGDTVIQAGQVKIFLDQMSSALLSEATLDYIDGPEQGFFIDNPKAQAERPEGSGGCSCGH
jgi:iron-sulfur cluster assembly accessory protein